jgi:glycosyltransferase involved in cell wall biosynthesis
MTAAPTLRVLVVARWYPAHDDVGRGIFVADLVRALVTLGTEAVVASWEPVLAADPVLAGGAGIAPVLDRLAVASKRAEPVAPRSWGAPWVPVVRLPAIVRSIEGVERDPLELAEFQSATLLPFGVALAERWPYAIVHAHTGIPDGLAAARLADRLGLPLLVTEHDSTIEARLADARVQDAYRTLLADRRRIVAVSPSFRDALTRGLGVDETAIGVVPNVVDVDAFRATAIESRDATELLWVGARKASKGTDTLLRAFAHVRSEQPGLHLRLVGSAPGPEEEARLQALAAALGIGDVVAFDPATDRSGVATAMARAAIFVHPSPHETFGVVAAEALAAGMPVAATPSGGVEGIIGDDGTCGTIADDTGEVALAAAIRTTLDRRFGFDPERLRARAVDRYSASVVAAATLDQYRALGVEVEPGSTSIQTGRAGPEAADVGTGTAPVNGPFSLPLVVGFRRRSATLRLGAVPFELARSLEILTTTAGLRVRDPLPTGCWIEVDAERDYREAVRRLGGPVGRTTGLRRLLRAVVHPVRTVRLRLLAGRRAEMLDTQRRLAVLAAVAQRVEDGLPAGPVLTLDADDVALLGPLLTDGLDLYPGTIRSVVDRWDAAGRPPLEVRGSSTSPIPEHRAPTSPPDRV